MVVTPGGTALAGAAISPKELDASGMVVANGTANCEVGNVAPAAVGTKTIAMWLEVSVQGTKHYIPMWT